MRVLVLGAGGQLGRDLLPALVACGHEVRGTTRSELDATDPSQVQAALAKGNFDRVVNCAAYTKVDQAESEAALAFAINRDGAGLVARVCAEAGVPLCHISTDFVFSQTVVGEPGPWRTTDVPQPKGVYAESKWAGERACQEAGGELFLVRTSWLYGNSGPNFPLAIVGAAARGRELKVVSDQVGCPTWTRDLSLGVAWLLTTTHFGTHHLCGQGSTTWCEFALAVLEGVGLSAKISPVSTAEWGAPAPRPRYSVLDSSEFLSLGGPGLSDWRTALHAYLDSERDGAVGAALSGA
ncbi:MAG: dTDP-4-dehydrorhamnose reductase [Candidatus Dormibacteria bacterium]